MAWGENNSKIDTYITALEAVPFRENDTVKTGKDNYNNVLDLALIKLRRRIIEKKRELKIVSKKLIQIERLVTRYEAQMEDSQIEDNYKAFNANISELANTSGDMDIMNINIVTIVRLEFEKIKEYRRIKKETLNNYTNLNSVISSLQEFKTILEEVKTKFS